MTVRSDFKAIYKGLSGSERVLIALKLWQEDKPDDPDILHGITHEQAREFGRLIDLINETHDQLGHFALHMEGLVHTLDLRLGCLASLRLWELELYKLTDELSAALDETKLPWATKEVILEVVFRRLGFEPDAAAAQLPRTQVYEMHLGILQQHYAQAWSQLLAAEAVVAAVRNEFAGEDPLAPFLRKTLDKARADMIDVGEGLKQYVEVLPEPEPEKNLLEALRERVFGADAVRARSLE